MTNRELAEQEFAVVAAQLTTEELNELAVRTLDGRIDGGTWRGGCTCFYGTVAQLRGALGFDTDLEDYWNFRDSFLPDPVGHWGDSALEIAIQHIEPGNTPEEYQPSEWLYDLLTAEITRRQS